MYIKIINSIWFGGTMSRRCRPSHNILGCPMTCHVYIASIGDRCVFLSCLCASIYLHSGIVRGPLSVWLSLSGNAHTPLRSTFHQPSVYSMCLRNLASSCYYNVSLCDCIFLKCDMR